MVKEGMEEAYPRNITVVHFSSSTALQKREKRSHIASSLIHFLTIKAQRRILSLEMCIYLYYNS